MLNKTVEDLFPMRLTLKVDGEEVASQKSNSFLLPFVESLHSHMTGENIVDKIILRSDATNDPDFNAGITEITSVSIVSGKLRITTLLSHNMNTGDYAYVMNVNTITPVNYLGWQHVTRIDATTLELTNTSGLSGTHSNATSVPYFRRGEQVTDTPDSANFGEPQIRVGGSTAANTVSTIGLEDEIPTDVASFTNARTFETSALSTVNTPSVGATDSDILIEQDFTNNSGGTIAVNEVGMWTIFNDSQGSFEHWHHCIIRDVLGSTVNVNDGQTLTVEYTLRTSVPATTGGVLIQFNEQLYRQLAQTSREAKTIDNLNSVLGVSAGQFKTAIGGGTSYPFTTKTGEVNERIGIQLGASTKSVVNTDYALQDGAGVDQRFPHGNGTDELYHSGTLIGPIETSGSNISFTLTKVFENDSGSTITVNDMGLYNGFHSTSTFTMQASHCIARFQVSPAETIADGEVAVAQITFQFTV